MGKRREPKTIGSLSVGVPYFCNDEWYTWRPSRQYWGWYFYASGDRSWREIGAVPSELKHCKANKLAFLLRNGIAYEDVPFKTFHT